MERFLGKISYKSYYILAYEKSKNNKIAFSMARLW